MIYFMSWCTWKLSFRVPFGMYSYTNICSHFSTQKPMRLTTFLWWTLERSSISVLNSFPPCIDHCSALLIATSIPLGRVPLKTYNHPKIFKYKTETAVEMFRDQFMKTEGQRCSLSFTHSSNSSKKGRLTKATVFALAQKIYYLEIYAWGACKLLILDIGI